MKAVVKKVKVLLLLAILLSMSLPVAADAAMMNDYCITPPFIVGGINPNLLLMIDNSGSQYDLGYVAGSTSAIPTISCGGASTATESLCYDNTYNDTYNYAGYYDRTKIYRYTETPADNAGAVGVNDYFSEAGAFPAFCTYSTAYLCVNTAVAGSVTTLTGFYATGNFLNWLTSSKFDIQKKILTGGKYSAGVLVGESRGCNGRRFVKVVPGINLTFSVRGPNALEPDYVNAATQGGLTRIEVYPVTNPNMDDCQCAVAEWTSGNFGQAQTDSRSCMNLANSGAQGNELNAFTHSLQTCWQIKDNFNKGLPAFGNMGNTPNIQDLLVDCEQAYTYLCGKVYLSGGNLYCDNNTAANNADDFLASQLPFKITNDTSGSWICTGYLDGLAPRVHITPAFPYYNALGPNNEGFLGQCLNPTNFQKQGANALDVAWPADESCVRNEILHYCFGSQVSEVQDPSSTDISSGNVPAVIMDASVRSLGAPAGTVFSRVSVASAPTGLINEFQGQIRFGAMTFNYNGSGSECNPGGIAGSNITCEAYCSVTTTTPCSVDANCPAGETCVPITKTNGGKIISYIGYDPVGDHTSGLVKAIDDIRAAAWTPFAEAFYESIGYFARTNEYTVAPGTSRTDTRLQVPDYLANQNPSQYRCQGNNVLIITDGMSTADLNPSVNATATAYSSLTGGLTGYDAANLCPPYSGSRSLDDLAWIAQNRNIKTLSLGDPTIKHCSNDFSITCTVDSNCSGGTCTSEPKNNSEFINTFVVYTGASNNSPGECNPTTLLTQTATKGGSTLYAANNPAELEARLREAFQSISAKAASGTAASVLASGEGSGANLAQAIFYPKRIFDATTQLSWIGTLQNYWYYLDPQLGSSTIREDTVADGQLKLDEDFIVDFYFNPDNNRTEGLRYASDATGHLGAQQTTLFLEDLYRLWESGRHLWGTAPSSRTLYTNCNINTALCIQPPNAYNYGLMNFSTESAAHLTALGTRMQAANVQEAEALIRYVRGEDTPFAPPITGFAPTYRGRTVSFTGLGTNVWKLGDIVNSTPRILSWIPLNKYDLAYADYTYKQFTSTTNYKKRGMVFTGANDGMLHAFNFGLLELVNDASNPSLKARLCNNVNNDENCDLPGELSSANLAELGKEKWAYIPRSALPYMKYLTDPDYCHLYFVDATPYILDASINIDTGASGQIADCTNPDYANYWECVKSANSWKTILIGGMRQGGGCRNSNASCSECVNTPVLNEGYSSYYALDITDVDNPKLLWEFSSEHLGYSTSGPAVVRVYDKTKNGRWFVVFGAGPSGYISTPTHQFMGSADHLGYGYLKLFVLDLKTGQLLRTINAGDSSAFIGSIINTTVDFNKDYEDDAFYVGYSSRAGFTASGTNQGSGPNSLILSAGSSATNDYYNGQYLHVYGQPVSPFGHETRLIVDYDGATKTAFVDSNWKLGPPAAGNQYDLLPGWTNGGVKRVVIPKSYASDVYVPAPAGCSAPAANDVNGYKNAALDPDCWYVSDVMPYGLGPVTTPVSLLQNFKGGSEEVRLFFGTGRYYYKVSDQIDDPHSPRRLFGVKEPCFPDPAITTSPSNIQFRCTTSVSTASLGNANTSVGTIDPDGWYINILPEGSDDTSMPCSTSSGTAVLCSDPTALYKAERMVSAPVASPTGAVFFTTFAPSTDICSFGGLTSLWAVKWDTGGSAADAGILKGKAVIQVSTGQIAEIDLGTSFTKKGHRKLATSVTGAPSAEGFTLLVPPPPVNKILHIKKR